MTTEERRARQSLPGLHDFCRDCSPSLPRHCWCDHAEVPAYVAGCLKGQGMTEKDAPQCRWFGGTANPEKNKGCQRPARHRERGLVLCDLHYDAAHMDPEDWTDEMTRVIPPVEPRCNPVGGVHALWCPDRPTPPAGGTDE